MSQLNFFDRLNNDDDRPKRIAELEKKEKWLVAETAFYLRCSTDHVYNLIFDGQIRAFNNERVLGRRADYRVYRDSVFAFEKQRLEGATPPSK